MSSNNTEEENLIARSELAKHNVQRYQFKTIIKNPEPIKEEPTPTPEPKTEEAHQEEPKPSGGSSLEKDLIDRLLQKTDELSSNLAKLQMQFEKQQIESEQRSKEARNDGYKDGLREGEEKAKKEMLLEVEKEKSSLIQSIVTIDKEMQRSQSHLEKLEKELSAIAVDIAKEVIVKEVETNSQKVALALTKELLSSVVEATDIHIKVNTIDYPYLNENLKDSPKIKLEADDAVAKGGVVISSNNGNVDGSLMARYRTLKQSVLDNLEA